MTIKAPESTCSQFCPSPPTSVGSFFANRIIALTKTAVSAVTCVFSGLSALVPFGQNGERVRRCALAAGTTLQGLRQFFYTANKEDYSRSRKCYNGFWERMSYNLQIANIPPCCDANDMRSRMIGPTAIRNVFKRILYPFNLEKTDQDNEQSSLVKNPINPEQVSFSQESF